jgi:ABC-type Mn2+/Zn2+ transport system permease subunit
MIGSFVESWPLFWATYLAGWGIAFLLSLVGVFVVSRQQIFLGAAVSQASTLGVALALLAGLLSSSELLHSDAFASGLAVLLSVAAALYIGREGGESAEARTGWVFLTSASLSILLLAHSPHGLEEIHRLLASSLIGADPLDAALFWVAGAAVAIGVAASLRSVLLFTVDPPMAAALGLRVGHWWLGTAVVLGISVGLSIRVSGLLYTFGCLVLPALIARAMLAELRSAVVAAPLIGVAASAMGFAIANEYDYPPAQVAVALLGAVLALAWIVGPLVVRSRPSASGLGGSGSSASPP